MRFDWCIVIKLASHWLLIGDVTVTPVPIGLITAISVTFIEFFANVGACKFCMRQNIECLQIHVSISMCFTNSLTSFHITPIIEYIHIIQGHTYMRVISIRGTRATNVTEVTVLIL